MSTHTPDELEAAYLRNLPEQVRTLSGRINDAELLKAWRTIDEAHSTHSTEAVTIPHVGAVEPGDLHAVWCWLIEVVKSRHAYEWTAIHDAQLERVALAAAEMQSCGRDEIDWDAFPDGDPAWDNVETALECALATLEAHA